MVVDSEPDSEDEGLVTRANSNYDKARKEWTDFEHYKMKKHQPIMDRSKSRILSAVDDEGKLREICVGPVQQKGENLLSGKNLADYVDTKGRFDFVTFFLHHKAQFPTIWLFAQKEAARRVVEVGCERFFSLSGYVSAPRRTRLGVRNYERLAMLSSLIKNVYIDMDWVAKQYLLRCKRKCWDNNKTVEALKCWNLERIIDADLVGEDAPIEMTYDEFVKELE